MWFVDEEIDEVVRRQGCYIVHPSDAQLPVMADALNVHEATGLTPSQLQARVTELEATLQMVRAVHESNTGAGRDSWVEVRRVLGVK